MGPLIVGGLVAAGIVAALVWMSRTAGRATQKATDTTKTAEATDAMLNAAVADGHDPTVADRRLRDGTF